MKQLTRLLAVVVIGLLSAGCSPAAPTPYEGGSPAATVPPVLTEPAATDETGCTASISPDESDRLVELLAEAAPGSTICLQGGIYTLADTLHIDNSGAESAPITLRGTSNQTTILDGGGETSGIIELGEGATYVHICCLTMRGFSVWGLTLDGSNQHVQLDHLHLEGGEAGLHFTVGDSGDAPLYGPVSDVIVSDTLVQNPVYTAIDCTPGPCDRMTFERIEVSGAGLAGESSFGADGIAVERGQDIRVSDSIIHDNGGDGIDLNSRDQDGNVPGIMVENNLVYRNRLQGIKLWAGGTMINNAVWGQGINPVVVGIYPGQYAVIENTIAYNMWDASFSGRDYAFVAAYPENGQSASISLTLIGNLFAFNTGPEVGSPTGLYLGENVTLADCGWNLFFSRPDGEIEAEFLGGDAAWISQEDIQQGRWESVSGCTGDRIGDPLFAAGWPGVDLHLTAGSPAIDSGSGTDQDLTGAPRDGQPDAGAYEFRVESP